MRLNPFNTGNIDVRGGGGMGGGGKLGCGALIIAGIGPNPKPQTPNPKPQTPNP